MMAGGGSCGFQTHFMAKLIASRGCLEYLFSDFCTGSKNHWAWSHQQRNC